jgi:hypothetical protein
MDDQRLRNDISVGRYPTAERALRPWRPRFSPMNRPPQWLKRAAWGCKPKD